MRHRGASVLIVLAIAACGVACGGRETPEQRLERLRLAHEIYPLGANTVIGEDGQPTLLVDVQVTNRGTEKLDRLTVLVRVRDEGGSEKASRRVSLDLTSTRPGVGVQMAASLPGVALDERDEVTIEIESNLEPETLRQLPEFANVSR